MIPAKSTTVSCATTAMRPKVMPARPHSAAGVGCKLRIAVLHPAVRRLVVETPLGSGAGARAGAQTRLTPELRSPHPSGLCDESPSSAAGGPGAPGS